MSGCLGACSDHSLGVTKTRIPIRLPPTNLVALSKFPNMAKPHLLL